MNHSIADQCMAHRYLYYVLSSPVISDWEYSKLEAKALADESLPENHPMQFPGSDVAAHYPVEIVELAMQLLRR